MFKSIFLFILCVSVFSNLNCKPVETSFEKFVKLNCSIPKTILGTKFPNNDTNSPDPFLKSLQICKLGRQNIEPISFQLCDEVFAVLFNISTCNPKLISTAILDYGISNITENSTNICSSFEDQNFVGNNDPGHLSSGLKIPKVCQAFCGKNMNLCDLLLWAYTVQNTLLGRYAVTTIDSRSQSLQTVPTTTTALAHISASAVKNTDTTQVKTASPVLTKSSINMTTNKFPTRTVLLKNNTEVSKLDLINQNKTTKAPNKVENEIGNTQNLSVENTTVSKNHKIAVAYKLEETNKPPNKKLKSKSLSSTIPNESDNIGDGKIPNLIPKVNQSNQLSQNGKVPNVGDDEYYGDEGPSYEDADYKNLNNRPAKDGQNSEIIPDKNSSTFQIGNSELSLGTELGSNMKKQNSKVVTDETSVTFQTENSKSDLSPNDHPQGSKPVSIIENKLTAGGSTHLIKISNSITMTTEPDTKTQEIEDKLSANEVQSTQPDVVHYDPLSVADEVSDLNSLTDKSSKGLIDNDKSTFAADDFASDVGSETQKFDSPASKFTEDTFLTGNQNTFPEQEDAHFFFYFLSMILVVIACYVIFHNKQKIIALIVEGCHERRRRPHGVNYRKLETK